MWSRGETENFVRRERSAKRAVEGRLARVDRPSTSLRTNGVFVCLLLSLTACRAEPETTRFPVAGRDVAPTVGDSFSTEDARDRLGEAEEVMTLAGVRAGMSVADVGAGEGYYSVRLARAVGPRGRVLAEDIDPSARDSLSDRVQREQLDNVAVKLGTPDNPMLPQRSFDRIFLVHMYHEVTSPYAFLWHLRDGVKPDGLVVVVDADRPVKSHGIPIVRLDCEFRALGLEPVASNNLEGGSYFRSYRVARERPAPGDIKPCRQ